MRYADEVGRCFGEPQPTDRFLNVSEAEFLRYNGPIKNSGEYSGGLVNHGLKRRRRNLLPFSSCGFKPGGLCLEDFGESLLRGITKRGAK
jgi:hypothetical protein